MAVPYCVGGEMLKLMDAGTESNKSVPRHPAANATCNDIAALSSTFRSGSTNNGQYDK